MSKVQRRCLDGSAILGCILLASVALMTGWESREQAQPVALTELVGWFRAQQQLVLPIAPPTADPFLQQGSPEALPFDPGDFPLEMLKQMPGKVQHDCPVYEIFLLEDPSTRATVILNGEGDAIYSVPAPTDYNPYAYAEAKFPELFSGTLGKMQTAALVAQYDPARIQVSVMLVPEDFYASYIAAEQALIDQQALESGGSMEPLGGGGTFAVTSIEYVGDHVELTFPGDSESYYVVESCVDPGDGVWFPVDVLLWEDYNMLWAGPDDPGAHRLNRVKEIDRANPRDQDGDGLDDVMEIEVHHTDPLNPDSDSDGLEDGDEILLQTDPLCADSDGDWASDGYEWEHNSDPNDPQQTPMLWIRINDGARFANSPALSVTFPGLEADHVLLATVDNFSDASSHALSAPIAYTLTNPTQGLQVLYARAFRGDPPAEQAGPYLSGAILLDTQAPALTVTEPLNGSTTSNPAVDVRGTVSDASGSIRVLVNGQWVQGVDEGQFQLEAVPLAPGQNTLTVEAIDEAGNLAQHIITVTHDTSGDYTAPAVSFALPENPLRVGDIETLHILGTSDDEYAIIEYTVTANGLTTGPHAAQVIHGQVFAQVPLQPGANVIAVTARDAAGNVDAFSQIVIRTEGVAFRIHTPTPYHVNNGPQIHVAGTAPTTFGHITVNGVAADTWPDGGALSFAATIPISPDPELITVRATAGGQAWYDHLVAIGYEILSYEHGTSDPYAGITYFSNEGYERWHAPINTWNLRWDADSLQQQTEVETLEWCETFTPPDSFQPSTTHDNPDPHVAYNVHYPPSGGHFAESFEIVTATPQSGVLGGMNLSQQDYDTSIRFRKYVPGVTKQLVVMHFKHLQCTGKPGEDQPDPSEITFFGEPGFAYGTDKIGFLLELVMGKEYVIDRNAFSWPDYSYTWPDQPPSSGFTFRRGRGLVFEEWGNVTISIEEPDGLPIQTIIDYRPYDPNRTDDYFRIATAWNGNPPRCFEWQYVHVDNEVKPYHLTQAIHASPEPTPTLQYHWDVSVGTLIEPNTASPRFVPEGISVPDNMQTVELSLEVSTPAAQSLVGTRTIEIYRDHLERDTQNFGIGRSCDAGWHCQRYSLNVPMWIRWNCHGSTRHAYDGTGNGQDSAQYAFYRNWPQATAEGSVEIPYPFSAAAVDVISEMTRGDIVVYYWTPFDDPTTIPAHSSTSLGGPLTYGANNGPMRFDQGEGYWEESWLWYSRSVFDCADDFSQHFPLCEPASAGTFSHICIFKKPGGST